MADDRRDARGPEQFGGTITGRWQNSPDDVEWLLEFHLTYRRTSGE
jgi:hypothetical protein